MSLKKSFLKTKPGVCKVTFTVEADAAQNAESITIAGDFNSWSSTSDQLKKKKDGSFEITKELEVGREYQFRYLIDGKRWENDWCADKYIPAPFSHTDNSVVSCVQE